MFCTAIIYPNTWNSGQKWVIKHIHHPWQQSLTWNGSCQSWGCTFLSSGPHTLLWEWLCGRCSVLREGPGEDGVWWYEMVCVGSSRMRMQLKAHIKINVRGLMSYLWVGLMKSIAGLIQISQPLSVHTHKVLSYWIPTNYNFLFLLNE